jgi:hypothetical protein
MLVQDLLILFSAANEGVINVLGTTILLNIFHLLTRVEHYFEMSKVDAETALSLYRHFCKQCEKVVEYLGVAKKLQNILNVQVPNMKHVRLLSCLLQITDICFSGTIITCRCAQGVPG